MKHISVFENFEGMPDVSVKMVIMSHLSDVQEMSDSDDVRDKLNFSKYLLMHHKDLSKEINPDAEYKRYKSMRVPGKNDESVLENEGEEYRKMLDQAIPQNSDGTVMSEADDICRRHKWEPDMVIAICYKMLVEINEHKLAKGFVKMVNDNI